MNNNDKFREQLPAQTEIEEFLKTVLFPTNPQNPFHLSELIAETQTHFKLPQEVVDLKLIEYGFKGHGNTGTFLECLVHFGTHTLVEEGMVKRVGPNQWAHHTCSLPAQSLPTISRKEVSQAVASVKILKRLNYEPERIKTELAHKWSLPVLNLAVRNVFQSA